MSRRQRHESGQRDEALNKNLRMHIFWELISADDLIKDMILFVDDSRNRPAEVKISDIKTRYGIDHQGQVKGEEVNG